MRRGLFDRPPPSTALARPLSRARCPPPLCNDGKRRRKPKAATDSAPPPPTPPAPPSRRVNQENSLLTVRQQVALVKAYRKAQQPAAPKQRVRFRRQKPADAEAAAAAAAKQDGDDASDANFTRAMPLLLVDGYNIIGKWPRLRKRRDKNDLAGARQLLLDDLVEYNSPKRWDIVVVFDAAGSTSDSAESYLGLAVVYALSADGYIEGESRRLGQEGVRKVHVATSDNQIRTACSSHGANPISAERMVQELKGSRAASARLVEEFNKLTNRGTGGQSGSLFAQLDEETKRMLASAEYEERAPRLTRAQRRMQREAAAEVVMADAEAGDADAQARILEPDDD